MDEQKKDGKKKKKEVDPDEIFLPPQITREPMSRQVVLGGKLTLRVTASGRPLPSFQWYLNGRKVSGANSDRLVVNKTRRDNAGAYTCEAKNFMGSAMSRAAMVSFLAKRVPEIVVEAQSGEAEIGKPFKIWVHSPKKEVLQTFNFQWMFNGRRIQGAKNHVLEFTEFKKKYEGEYKVIIIAGDIHASNVVSVRAGESSTIAPEKVTEAASAPLEDSAPKQNGTFFFDPLIDDDHPPAAEDDELSLDLEQNQVKEPPKQNKRKIFLEKLLRRFEAKKLAA